ncbi:MAG TPA: hypothetical protein VFT22_18020 [Kofleriaceae bacterium]|nr:hypothetical protein [Kofleriaceae bacterium]
MMVAPPITPEPAREPPEDEWEWEIAMARARTAIEWDAEPIVLPATLPSASSEWVATQPLASLGDDGHDTVVCPPGRLDSDDAARSEAGKHALSGERRSAPPPARPVPAAGNPRTVIPGPRLPPAADPRAVARSMPTPRVRSERSPVPSPRVMSARHVVRR